MKPRGSDIRALTGLRGVAVMQVVVYHYFENTNAGVLQPLVGRGYLAVDLFFVLSGFVMALNYAALRSFDLRRYGAFLWKRAGRIYPLYLFGIAVSLVFGALGLRHGMPSSEELATNLLLVQAWGWGGSINGPTWSISTELAAYLAFPWLAAVALHPRMRWLAAGAAVVLLITVATRSDAQLGQTSDVVLRRHGPLDVYDGTTAWPVLRCIAGFVLGLFTYTLASTPAACRLVDGRAFVIVLAIVALLYLGPDGDVPIVLLFVPLVLSLHHSRSRTARFLGNDPLHAVGIISFSIYVNHRLLNLVLRAPIAAAFGWLDPGMAWLVAGLLEIVPLIAVSVATYRWIEEPARRNARGLLVGWVARPSLEIGAR